VQAVWDSNPNNKLYKILPKLQHVLHQSYTRKDQTVLNQSQNILGWED